MQCSATLATSAQSLPSTGPASSRAHRAPLRGTRTLNEERILDPARRTTPRQKEYGHWIIDSLADARTLTNCDVVVDKHEPLRTLRAVGYPCSMIRPLLYYLDIGLLYLTDLTTVDNEEDDAQESHPQAFAVSRAAGRQLTSTGRACAASFSSVK